jgi:ATP-dependent Lon protease
MPKQVADKKKNYKKNKPDSDSEESDGSETVYTTESDSDFNDSYTSSEIETPKSKKKNKNKKNNNDADDLAELHKTLQSLFPSQYMSKKVKDDKKNKKNKEQEKKRAREREKEKKKKRHQREKTKYRKSRDSDSDSDSDYEDENDEESSVYEDFDDDDDDNYEDIDSDEEEEEENDDGDEDDEQDEDDNEDADGYYIEDSNENDKKDFKITLTCGVPISMKNKVNSRASNDEYGSDDEKTFMKENYDSSVGLPLTTSCQSLVSNASSTPKQKKPKKKEDDAMSDVVNIEDKYKEIIELKKVLVEKLRTKPNNVIVRKALKQCDKSIKKLIKNARTKNAETYEELLSYADAQETVDELGYFKRKLSNKEQLQIMTDLHEINKFMYVEKPYRLSLLQSNIPPKFKAIAIQRLNQLSMMEPGENEYFKLKNWVDNFMRIPFNVHKNLTININDGIDKCSEYVISAKKQLDTCVFGLNDAKMQIMQMLGQWISNPSSMGTAIAIHGPAGTGKTSLVKEGISKILGREFAFIALGGCGDSSFLEGHSYTYEGSTWGKIVQILIESKCMNPVIYFDELDKVSDTARGQEIIGILTHLTDTTQNSQFHDKYFSEIDLDLSKCLFIFSYNDEKLVNPILKDRMYRIVTKGYETKEKITIARNYMLPKIREQVGFGPDDVVIGDDVLGHIISNQARGEEGVRNLKRTLEIIHTKLNLYRLIRSDDKALFEKDMGLAVSFPHVLTKKDVDTLVKTNECANQSVLYNMYI